MTIGILLAGGKSSRFKQGDKALFSDKRFKKTWVEHAFELLSSVSEPVYISANPNNQHEIKKIIPSATLLLDESVFSGEGPLAALYTISHEQGKLHQIKDYLIIAVDYPELSSKSLQLLVSQKNTYVEKHFTLTHLSFSHNQISNFLQSGNRRMRDFLNFLEATPILISEAEVQNHNYE